MSVVIASRAGMAAAVNEIVSTRLRHAELTAQMEQEIAGVQRRYATRLAEMEGTIANTEAGVRVYCEEHRSQVFTGKKSVELGMATVGFRETPYRVEKLRAKDTWEEIAGRMAGMRIAGNEGKGMEFLGENYVTYREPALAKTRLLQDRVNIPGEVLKAAGIRFAFDEVFYIAARSLVGSVREAA